ERFSSHNKDKRFEVDKTNDEYLRRHFIEARKIKEEEREKKEKQKRRERGEIVSEDEQEDNEENEEEEEEDDDDDDEEEEDLEISDSDINEEDIINEDEDINEDEVAELIKYKIYTNDEMKAILKRRETYMYNISQHTRDISGFEHFINYERGLLSETRRRRQEAGLMPLQSEFKCVSRIHWIQEKLLRRYYFSVKQWI
ncbi:MAG: hypothetical protein EZS28_053773, partial [Streblomastix strix]